MYQTFDAFEYAEYLRRRWRVVATACCVALVLSLGISLLLPKRYTATASIIIEPPGGNDVRLSTAVSPIYLESLKTYERFANGDTLFARAAEHFHLLSNGNEESIESLKKKVLKVAKLRDTKILEISATLTDPKTAQSLVQYLADETVATSKGESAASDRDFIGRAGKQTDDARLRLEQAQKALSSFAASAPVESLQAEIDNSVELQAKIQQQLVAAEADVAEYQAQPEGPFAREQLQAARARVALLQKRSADLAQSIQRSSQTLASRIAKRDQMQTEAKLAQSAYEALSNRLRDLEVTAGSHAEQLRVIDPGIVPQRPSSPNIPLNVAAALFLALLSSIIYLSLAFASRRRSVGFEPAVPRGMRA